MDSRRFNALYLNQGGFEYGVPFIAWCRYFVECENYDRLVCSMRGIDGTALPYDAREFESVNYNAHQMRKKHIAPLLEVFPHEEIQVAKESAGRLSYYQQQQIVFSEDQKAGGE